MTTDAKKEDHRVRAQAAVSSLRACVARIKKELNIDVVLGDGRFILTLHNEEGTDSVFFADLEE